MQCLKKIVAQTGSKEGRGLNDAACPSLIPCFGSTLVGQTVHPTAMTKQIIEADLTWVDDAFVPRVRISISDDGRIDAVGELSDRTPTRRLTRKAIIPGFVNAHSHAFQRGLRGKGERFSERRRGSFWSWREEMYQLVEAIDEERLYALSRQAFEESRLAGITTVGEFHYLHHDQSGAGFAFDEIVLRAASDAGIRLALLSGFYEAGGLDHTGYAPLSGGQRRFATRSMSEYWQQIDQLMDVLDSATQSIGVVAHSIRAVPIDTIRDLYREACRRGLPFHMHVEEQPREVEDCVRHYGKTPMALINEHLQPGPNFTAVHATHTAEADLDEFISAGGNICICPLTEANLGDGLANVPWIVKHGGPVCFGTDSNARISMIEEMRLLEYGQRLLHQRRGIVTDECGRVAHPLLDYATIHGGRSLGLRCGTIKPGMFADLAVVDLESPALASVDADFLLDAIIFGADNGIICATSVGGTWSDAVAMEDVE